MPPVSLHQGTGKTPATQGKLITPQTSDDLVGSFDPELIMLCGKDGVGKSSAIVSMAAWVAVEHPEATFNVIDTENKFKAALKAYGPDYPKNISYYKADTMNDVTNAISSIASGAKLGDWCAVESMARVWERAQNLGYESVAGVSKIEYLERKRSDKSIKSPIPKPDDFWAIVKGAHDAAFFDLITQSDYLNTILTTTVTKPRSEGFIKESADRKGIRAELGIDVGLDGAPRLPYYIKTMALLEVSGGKVTCRVLRDNLTTGEGRVEFEVPDKRAFAPYFYGTCRG